MSKDIPSEGKAKVLLFGRDFFCFLGLLYSNLNLNTLPECKFAYQMVNSALLIPCAEYQRVLHVEKVAHIAENFSEYEGEYSRERLVQQLARTHPKTITQLAQKDTGSSANRHMRQILRIYNGASREMSLPLKN